MAAAFMHEHTLQRTDALRTYKSAHTAQASKRKRRPAWERSYDDLHESIDDDFKDLHGSIHNNGDLHESIDDIVMTYMRA